MERDDATTELGFSGTQVRDDGEGPMLVAHKQRLFVVTGPDRGLEKEVEATRVTIGTAASNDLQLTDPTVSRRHCEISVREDRYFIRDLGSTNGTGVNGTPVVEAILAPGARIRVGDSEVLFEPKKKWERIRERDEPHFGNLKGSSQKMRSVFSMLAKVAATELSCVIVGETGTGKELAARGVHENSPRASKPFIVVDCGAVQKNLIGAELFGHEKGAFTGADRQRVGAFEAAHGGTIFLDEIGELPIDLQPQLLRVLERREVKRLGSNRHAEVDVRVVAATHRDLRKMAREGDFREDLYYRLAEVVVDLPPLRERLDDIDIIVRHIIEEHARDGSPVRYIDPAALQVLRERPWPGNVRELRNVMRRAIALATGPSIRKDDLVVMGSQVEPVPPPPMGAGLPLPEVNESLPIKEAREKWVAPMEREYLMRLLQKTKGDLNLASQDAGIHRKSLERLLRQHGLKASDVKKK